MGLCAGKASAVFATSAGGDEGENEVLAAAEVAAWVPPAAKRLSTSGATEEGEAGEGARGRGSLLAAKLPAELLLDALPAPAGLVPLLLQTGGRDIGAAADECILIVRLGTPAMTCGRHHMRVRNREGTGTPLYNPHPMGKAAVECNWGYYGPLI
jgi:hypothetical protein